MIFAQHLIVSIVAIVAIVWYPLTFPLTPLVDYVSTIRLQHVTPASAFASSETSTMQTL